MSRRRFRTDDIDKFFDYGINIPLRTIYLGSGSYDTDGNESGVDGLLAERIITSLIKKIIKISRTYLSLNVSFLIKSEIIFTTSIITMNSSIKIIAL